ncbi:MAG: hypothetical protein LBQ52_04955 [Helicobacteraceae bacterium]|jgi:hypothetical protein|nr:hypothetical protein [Helicobacteraceae bacterium]
MKKARSEGNIACRIQIFLFVSATTLGVMLISLVLDALHYVDGYLVMLSYGSILFIGIPLLLYWKEIRTVFRTVFLRYALFLVPIVVLCVAIVYVISVFDEFSSGTLEMVGLIGFAAFVATVPLMTEN